MSRLIIALVFAVFISQCVTATLADESDEVRNSLHRNKIEQLLEAMNKKFDTAFASFASEDIHIEIPPDHKWQGPRAVLNYINQMSIAKLKVKVISPINVAHGSVAFKKEMSGVFKNGCDFYVTDVVQVAQFDQDDRLSVWTEYFPRLDFFRQQKCAKAQRREEKQKKDEL